VPEDRSVEAASRWIAGEPDRRASGRALDLVVHPIGDPARVLGEVGLVLDPSAPQAEAGWWLAADARGRGCATSALRLVTAWALGSLGLTRIAARTVHENPAGGAVAERAGWKHVSGPDGVDLWIAETRSDA
jgi:RimJ/RimL family protein N-acetyltransferase